MSDLMVLDMNQLGIVYDADQAAELTKNMTAGFGGNFQKSARLTMGNSGDWELIDEDGEIHDMGREVNIVIVDQREYISRVHYPRSFDEMKASGEFDSPDCQSFDGISPDAGCADPKSDKCKTCTVGESGLSCSFYRRVVGVIAYQDGGFSDPFILEPKSKSLFDKTVVSDRYGNYGWYMNTLASQKQNGVAMPIPVQWVVTKCMPLPKMTVSTMKFGIASTAQGGYWVLTPEQRQHIMKLRDSEEVKEMLKPFNAATNNPSTAGRIAVKNVETTNETTTTIVESASTSEPETPVKKGPPTRKSAPTKKEPPTKKVKMVVLGIDHPDVVNTKEYDYAELKIWAEGATEAELNAFLAVDFPQALVPVEVPDDEPETPVKKGPPARKSAPTKKVEPESDGINQDDKKKAEEMAKELSDFDD